MDFELSEEQRQIQRMTREFVQERITPHATDWDRAEAFPLELLGQLAELGLLSVCVPEEYDGSGADFLTYILVLEELARGDAGVAVTVAVHTSLATLPLLNFGTEEQKQTWVTRLARGEIIGAYALTEPGAGSDAAALIATVRPDGNTYVLNGAKHFITNAGLADMVIVFAREPGTKGPKGISAFIVDTQLGGVSIGKEEEKLGLHSSSTCAVILDDVRVSGDCRLGEEGEGFKVALNTLDSGRIGIAAQAIGITQAALDVSLTYSQQRFQFGRPISDFQAIQWKLAEMDRDLDAARLLAYRAAWLKDQGRNHTAEAAKAKLFASDMARRHTAEAVQVLGGYGYTKEFPVERYYRDAKITEIYEGTSEIQHIVISRALLGRK